MSELILNNLIMYPRAVLRSSFVILCNIYCIPTYVVWMTLLLPIKHYNTQLYYRIEGLLYHWLLSVVSLWSYSAGYDIVEVGDDITPCRKKNQRTLVIANHQSTADVPLMMACFNVKQDVLPNIMWIMDRLFQFTNFGIVSLIHQDFFITSGKNTRDASLVQFRKHIEESFIRNCRNWMVLFPEGGFLRKRKEVSQRYAQKNNLPTLNNVTLPRIGALKTAFSVLPPQLHTSTMANNNSQTPKRMGNGISASGCSDGRVGGVVENNVGIGYDNHDGTTTNLPNKSRTSTAQFLNHDEITDDIPLRSKQHLDYILDITIAYPEGKPLDLPTIVHGLRYPCRTHFFYRLYHSSEVPKEEHALTKWLYDRWTEKEKILEYFYANGHFNQFTSSTPAVVQQDMLRFLIINLFFITSSYVHLQMFLMLISYWNDLYVYSFV